MIRRSSEIVLDFDEVMNEVMKKNMQNSLINFLYKLDKRFERYRDPFTRAAEVQHLWHQATLIRPET
jgi:hypothetical protein